MLPGKSSWNSGIWAAKSRFLTAISPSVLYQQSSVDPKMLSSTLFSQQHPIFIQQWVIVWRKRGAFLYHPGLPAIRRFPFDWQWIVSIIALLPG